MQKQQIKKTKEKKPNRTERMQTDSMIQQYIMKLIIILRRHESNELIVSNGIFGWLVC